MKNKKQKIKPQGPWQIIPHSEKQIDESGNEFDPGHIEFYHHETKIVIYREMSWFKGEGVFAADNFKIPSMVEIWKMLSGITPGMSVIIYDNWHIERVPGCFVARLANIEINKYIDKKVLSDLTCSKIDIPSFL